MEEHGIFDHGESERRRFQGRRHQDAVDACLWCRRTVEAAPPLEDEERWAFGVKTEEAMVLISYLHGKLLILELVFMGIGKGLFIIIIFLG